MHDPTTAQSLVIFAKDKDRVSAFYRLALGLEAVESERGHDLLRGVGIELVIHAIPDRIAAGIEISEPPAVRETAVFKPAFVVADLEAVRRVAEQSGGGLKPQEDAWSIRGATVLDGWDPEGNVVQFRMLET